MSLQAQIRQKLPWDKFTVGDIHVTSQDTAKQLEKQEACEVLHRWDDTKEKLVPDGSGAWKVVPLKA